MVSVSIGASSKLDKGGGTLTGPLILARDPVDNLEAATRQWVLANAAGSTPGSTVVAETGYGQASAVGTLLTYAREDHTHGSPALTSSAPAVTLGIGQAGATGTATLPARADHAHPMAASAVAGASAVGDTASAGAASTFAASDHRHGREGFGGTTPQTSYGAASGAGTALTPARSDHTHGTPGLTTTAPGTTLAIGTAAALGTAVLPALADHVHPMAAAGIAGASAVGDTAAAGSASTFAPSDHRHAREAFGAVTGQTAFGLAAANGSAASLARSDHTHGTPSELDYAAQVTGLVAAPFSPYLCNTITLGLTSGFVLLTLVRPGAVTITNLGVWVGTASATGTGVNAMALYSEAGALIDQTGDMTALLTGASANSYVEAALGSSHQLADATNYYIAILCHNSTAPKIAGYLQSTAVTVPPIKGHYPSLQVSGQSSFPASFTPSTATKNNAVYWLAGS